MSEKVLVLTVGLPRSGKSTWAAKQELPVVNPDSIRLVLHGGAYRAAVEPMVWAIADVMVRSLFIAGSEQVILDATNITVATRRKWVSQEWETLVMEFAATEQECVARAVAGGRQDLVPVIGRMASMFEPPTEMAQYDDRYYIA